MHYTYIIESLAKNGELYIGCTGNLESRLGSHNAGSNLSTKRICSHEAQALHGFGNQETGRTL
ncbi:GIY-YIG nuclease family protein [Fibrobacterota bacterium]